MTDRLDLPRERGLRLRVHYDPEAFGQLSEQIARFLGTARFLVYMTVFVAVWVLWNVLAPVNLRFDPYPFIFLTLILSLQASYAAPLILPAVPSCCPGPRTRGTGSRPRRHACSRGRWAAHSAGSARRSHDPDAGNTWERQRSRTRWVAEWSWRVAGPFDRAVIHRLPAYS